MSEFLLKPRIRFGQDALSALAEQPARQALLVTDQVMVQVGLADRVTQILRQRGIAFQLWDDVVADPDITTVVRGMKLMDSCYPDLVIALGGGSVIDAAKAVMFALAQTRPNLGRERPCFVAIPTTSGTGSEVTSFSVVKARSEKLVLVDPSLLPGRHRDGRAVPCAGGLCLPGGQRFFRRIGGEGGATDLSLPARLLAQRSRSAGTGEDAQRLLHGWHGLH